MYERCCCVLCSCVFLSPVRGKRFTRDARFDNNNERCFLYLPGTRYETSITTAADVFFLMT